MKRIGLFLVLFCALFNCKSDQISESERKAIVLQLEDIYSLDQEYAGLPPKALMDKHGHEKAWELFKKMRDSVGLINQKKIKTLFETYGYLGYDKVGKEASSNFWISIQHADNDVKFQQDILQSLKQEIEKGNASKTDYAMLEDRVNVNLGKPQRFGSQVTYNDLGQAVPKNGLADSTKVEQLRLEYDLPSFKTYYNNMTKNHFEMNKQMFLEQGIDTPVLYQ